MLGISILFSIALVGALVEIVTGGRIVNGTDAEPGEFPFMASLRFTEDGSHFCGATIVNECYVLTAAHCIIYPDPEAIQVVVGTLTLSSGGVVYGVSEMIKHEGYNPDNMFIHDIALLKLSSRIIYSDLIQPGTLPVEMEPTPAHMPAKVVGWGVPYSEDNATNDLQKVDIAIYSDSQCKDVHVYKIHDSNICAGVPEGGKGMCQGDSGGPLLANGHQVGIVSWTLPPCGLAGYPGVFTEVSWYIDWINQYANKC